MSNLIIKLVSFLDPGARLRIGLLLPAMLVVSILDMTSILLILPVIQVVIMGEADDWSTRLLMELLPDRPAGDLAIWVAGSFAVLFAVKNALLLTLTYLINRRVYHELAVFIGHLYGSYLSRSLVFHFQRNSAELLRNLLMGTGHTFEAIRFVLVMLLDGLLVVAAFGLLLFVEPMVTLIVAVVLASIGVAFYRIAAPVFLHWGEREMALEGDLIKWINQTLGTIRDVKLLGAHDFFLNKVSTSAKHRATFMSRASTSTQIPRVLIETVVVIGFLLVVVLFLTIERPTGEVIATLGLYAMAALRLMPSVNRILSNAAELRHRMSYIDALHRDLADGRADTDRGTVPEQVPPLSFDREIRFEAIAYAYPDAVHHALRGIDAVIAKGQSVGFVGPSGAGKSTLVDIVLGLLRPQSGRLLIDGNDAFVNLPAWQGRIGFVPQQVGLIDETMRRNIAFGLEDKDIDEDRMNEVVRLAHLDDIISRLPHGLSTVLGESGVRLSGGQRQRVAIARALYRNPDVLVFDEATSALDTETEREITKAIETLAGDRTILIIAHRLSTVRNCDKLVFMEEGRVAAVGRFDELVRDNAEFRRLVQAGDIDTHVPNHISPGKTEGPPECR